MNKTDIKSLTLPQIESIFSENKIQKFRAEQVYLWLQQGVLSFEEMTNIPKTLKSFLNENFFIAGCLIEKKLVSRLDGTVKYLFKLYDGECIESVLMRYHHGFSLCVSTQAGCRMGCSFCASTTGGLVRNLLPSEMLGQIQSVQRDLNIRISNIVMMGIGEPLDNYRNVIAFLNFLKNEKGVNIGSRHISLSTSGHVDGIYKLIKENSQLTLSVSLHAPNDEIRSKLMPINNKWNINALMNACKDYVKATNRRISFEYAMIEGVNDGDGSALQLSALLKGMLCHINLIPANAVEGKRYKASSDKRLNAFKTILEKNGLNVTVRRTLGSDINASCGQLRRSNQ